MFFSFLGATSEIASRLLEACGGNLEMAIGMHMDGAGGAAGGVGPTDTARAGNSRNSVEQQEVESQGAQKYAILRTP